MSTIDSAQEETSTDAAEAFGFKKDVVTSDDLLDAAIQFADGDISPRLEVRLRATFISPPGKKSTFLRTSGPADEPWNWETDEYSRKQALEICVQELDKERDSAHTMLRFAATDSGLPEYIKAGISRGFRTSVSLQPHITFGVKELRLTYRMTGSRTNTDGWMLYLIALLAENKSGFGRSIGYCVYEPCQKLFRVDAKGPGRPRTKYCCDEHMLAQHNVDSVNRPRTARTKRKHK